MAKDQKDISGRPKLTEEQRLTRICSILSIGIMRRIHAEKTTGPAIEIDGGVNVTRQEFS
ncbi:MAG: hypothetical protein HXX11_14080 [Desulfuromonadales bacterium]|nr:hypothetical protein [Desulfuromonadales bacterium]